MTGSGFDVEGPAVRGTGQCGALEVSVGERSAGVRTDPVHRNHRPASPSEHHRSAVGQHLDEFVAQFVLAQHVDEIVFGGGERWRVPVGVVCVEWRSRYRGFGIERTVGCAQPGAEPSAEARPQTP